MNRMSKITKVKRDRFKVLEYIYYGHRIEKTNGGSLKWKDRKHIKVPSLRDPVVSWLVKADLIDGVSYTLTKLGEVFMKKWKLEIKMQQLQNPS